jgi:hypothetical protein
LFKNPAQDVRQKFAVRERAKLYQYTYLDSVSADGRGGFEGVEVKMRR